MGFRDVESLISRVDGRLIRAEIAVGRCMLSVHTKKYFRNLIKSTRYQIVFTIFLLSWNQTYARLVPNQLENGKYNLISG